MVRNASSKTTTTTTTASTVPPPAASTPVAEKKSSKKTSDTKKVVAAEPPAVPPKEEEEPLENKIVAVEEPSLTSVKMLELSARVQQLTTILSAIKGDIKTLEKSFARELKAAQKSSKKRPKKNGNHQPSGFNKPALLSDELAQFLNKPLATKMARTDVTTEINKYIHTNNLLDPTNGRFIVADTALTTLLKLEPTDQLSYFNLQKFMKHHFIKEEVAAAPQA